MAIKKLPAEKLAPFDKKVSELLIDGFKQGRLESLFSLIKAYSPEFSPPTCYRLAILSKVHRTGEKGSTLEWTNLVGQLCLTPDAAGTGHQLSMGGFSARPFAPCAACKGDAIDPASVGKTDKTLPEFLATLECDLHNAVWETLEDGGLWGALRDLRELVEVAGSEYTYQLDFRSEYITRDRKTQALTPKRLTVIASISFPFKASAAKKPQPVIEPKPGMAPAGPCKKCGGSGFARKRPI